MADLQRKSYNLFDKDNATIESAYLSDYGTGFWWVSSSDSRSVKMPCEANTQYTLSVTTALSIFRVGLSDDANPSPTGIDVIKVINGSNINQYTFTTGASDKYIIFQGTANAVSTWINELMLNTGSTAKPYEPYGWIHSLRKLTTATEAVVNPLYSDGTAITSYTIKGNTVQNGTPTPSNPVAVNGVGERTENLYNIANVVENTFIKANTTGSPLGSEISNSDWSCSDYIEVSPNTEYTVQYPVYVYAAAAGLVFFTSKSVSSAIEGVTTATQGSKTYTFTTPNNCNYVRFSWGNSKGNETMFVTGGTAKTYEPYGYKIPITTLQGSAYVYLNEPLCKIDDYADTINSNGTVTRVIKKINLGDKEYTISSSGSFYTRLGDGVIVGNGQVAPALCTDFKVVSANAYASTEYSLCAAINTQSQVSINKTGYEGMTEAEFKAAMNGKYLYYALATPTTEQITLPSIPTADGANSISIDTTVQPSEFTATWTGWHNANVKEWDGSDWQ